MKILVTPRSFGKTNPELFDRLAQAGLEVIRNDTGGILSAEQMKEKLADCAGVILGVDPMDAPVLAAADGVVVVANYHNEFGNVVDIDHGDGLISRYAHLSRLDTQAGALVKRGTQIGAVGSTGRSTGPHLHFEVRMLGVAQNPALFLKKGAEFAQVKRR